MNEKNGKKRKSISHLSICFLRAQNCFFTEFFPHLKQFRKKHVGWVSEEAVRDSTDLKRQKSTGVIPILLHTASAFPAPDSDRVVLLTQKFEGQVSFTYLLGPFLLYIQDFFQVRCFLQIGSLALIQFIFYYILVLGLHILHSVFEVLSTRSPT